MSLLSPELVVVGGPLAAAGELVVEGIERTLGRLDLGSVRARIRVSTLAEDAALGGALLSVIEHCVPSVRVVSTTANASAS